MDFLCDRLWPPAQGSSWGPPTTGLAYGGNPARFLKKRFDDELTDLLLRFRWWDLEAEALVAVLPPLCDPDLEKVRQTLRERFA